MKVFYSYIETIHKDEHERNVARIKRFLEKIPSIKVVEYKIDKADTEINDKSNRSSESLQASDIFIGEMSKPSQSLGFLLGLAINQKKPCLYLYDESTRYGKPKSVIKNRPSRLLVIKPYNQKNIKVILLNFLKKAEKQLLSDRITFVCSKAIKNYINNESKRSGIAKGEIIRTIIEDKINQELS